MAVQRNFQWYRYVDDSARNWAIRADKDNGDNASFGMAAFNAADPPFGRQTVRHRPRFVIYQDNATFRTVRVVCGTAAAFAAAPATLSVSVPGDATAVTYNLAGKVGEKLQVPKASRNADDHA